ncbi:hypothetical protein [Agriterribacter sp.]|uniref:hypothetical protein n=1 Tax=Agriterribacter sp. TaxID=2821509 RepID=UPI002D04DFA7|nr:hypothetical protein [Agriterribacter sp.]HRP56913.1 hypothetical protein [Agriterribacter sp.]
MELISTRRCFVSITGEKSPMNRFAVSRHIVNIRVTKFIMLMQVLLLLAVYGFSQEDPPSLGELQIKNCRFASH